MHAFSDDLYEDLLDAMEASISDDNVAAFVLAGTGRYFSSGADIRSSNATHGQDPRGKERHALEHPSGRFMMSLIGYPKLLAAAVQGPVVGIATTMLMHFDLVHASSRATFWAPFSRLALVPELCSSVTYREVMGISKANELLLLGRTIDAKTAYEWNMISRVVPEPTPSTKSNPLWLADKLCATLDSNLMALPLGNRTASYFVNLVRNPERKQRLVEVCRNEIKYLDERFNSGQVATAFRALTKIHKRSRL